MKEQSYSNHVRYYPPHHFIFYPLMGLAIAVTAYRAVHDDALRDVWIAICFVLVICTWVAYMLRQHYALMVQNRVVRLEMRLRYFQLAGQRFEPLERKLNFGQIAALRFAGDEELLSLVEQSVKESLPAKEIKKLIRNWQPDHMRV